MTNNQYDSVPQGFYTREQQENKREERKIIKRIIAVAALSLSTIITSVNLTNPYKNTPEQLQYVAVSSALDSLKPSKSLCDKVSDSSKNDIWGVVDASENVGITPSVLESISNEYSRLSQLKDELSKDEAVMNCAYFEDVRSNTIFGTAGITALAVVALLYNTLGNLVKIKEKYRAERSLQNDSRGN